MCQAREGGVRIQFEELSERREGGPFTGVRTIAVDRLAVRCRRRRARGPGRILDGRFDDRAAMQEALAGAGVRSLKALLVIADVFGQRAEAPVPSRPRSAGRRAAPGGKASSQLPQRREDARAPAFKRAFGAFPSRSLQPVPRTLDYEMHR